MHSSQRQQGFAAVTALILVVVVGVMAVTLFALTNAEMAVSKATTDSTVGFYAAEAGLNIRSTELKEVFVGYNRPEGNEPGNCSSGEAAGTKDYLCKTQTIQARRVVTYAGEDTCSDQLDGAGNSSNDGVCDVVGDELVPISKQIPTDQRFGGLNAQEYTYTVVSEAYSPQDELEARLGMRLRSRLVPLFQFAAFTKDDLEIYNGADLNLSGRVHSNSDIIFGPGGGDLKIKGQVTTAGKVKIGRIPPRDNSTECRGDVRVNIGSGEDDDDYKSIRTRSGSSCRPEEIAEEALESARGAVQQDIDPIEIPDTGVIDRDPDNANAVYWQKADIRLVLNLKAIPPAVEVRYVDDTVNTNLTNKLNGCNGASSVSHSNPLLQLAKQSSPVGYSNTFYNRRENTYIDMLDVDMNAFMKCMDEEAGFPELDDETEGGLVVHMSVAGDDEAKINNYGVRLKNGEELNQKINGLTVVTDQALYVQGHYNKEGDDDSDKKKKPASLLADSLNVLSEDWCDTRPKKDDKCQDKFNTNRNLNPPGIMTTKENEDAAEKEAKENGVKYFNPSPLRPAKNTTINAAMMANMDETDDSVSWGYNGGLENYPRLHENWSVGGKKTLKIRGSFVSLGRPKHVDGGWAWTSYSPPKRDWDYDTDFNVADKLPPLSPRFVLLVQEVFLRDFEQN